MAQGGAGVDSQHGSGLPLRSFSEDARALPASEFEDRHGSGFLLLSTAGLQVPAGPAMTEVRLDDGDAQGGERTASVAVLAYALRRSERSVGHLVTIGRTANNDVVIPDLSVSRFHAFVKPGADGSLQIQDANSTNGSTVNGRSIPAQGQGTAVSLKAGDTVRLGQVELTFVDGPALQQFVRAHTD